MISDDPMTLNSSDDGPTLQACGTWNIIIGTFVTIRSTIFSHPYTGNMCSTIAKACRRTG